jgi:hypothetical protein
LLSARILSYSEFHQVQITGYRRLKTGIGDDGNGIKRKNLS